MLWRRQRNASLQNLFPEKCSIFFLRVGPVYLSSAKIVSVPYQINALPGGDEIEGSNWIMSALLLIHKILTREISTIRLETEQKRNCHRTGVIGIQVSTCSVDCWCIVSQVPKHVCVFFVFCFFIQVLSLRYQDSHLLFMLWK